MSANLNTPPSAAALAEHRPILDARTRLRLGLQLQALYEPVIDEVLDPRLAELLQQLETDRDQLPAGYRSTDIGVLTHSVT
ncbi:hypothetical protein [Methylorubrum extorquens]